MSETTNRLVKLEAENISLHEEILQLKKKLTAANLSSAGVTEEEFQHMKDVINLLQEQVIQCIRELEKYRQQTTPSQPVAVGVSQNPGVVTSQLQPAASKPPPTIRPIVKQNESPIFDLDELLK
jgi:hypothetical protein